MRHSVTAALPSCHYRLDTLLDSEFDLSSLRERNTLPHIPKYMLNNLRAW